MKIGKINQLSPSPHHSDGGTFKEFWARQRKNLRKTIRATMNESVREMTAEILHGITPEMLLKDGWHKSHESETVVVWMLGANLRFWTGKNQPSQLQWRNGDVWNVFPNPPTLSQLRAVVELTRDIIHPAGQ